MGLGTTLRWLGSTWAKSPLAWALFLTPVLVGYLIEGHAGDIEDSGQRDLAQLGYLTGLLAVACSVEWQRQLTCLHGRLPAVQRLWGETRILVASIAGLAVLPSLLLQQLIPGLALPWAALVIAWIHLAATGLVVLRIRHRSVPAGLILVGIGWILPCALPILGPIEGLALLPSPAILQAPAEDVGFAELLPAVALFFIALCLVISGKFGGARTMKVAQERA